MNINSLRLLFGSPRYKEKKGKIGCLKTHFSQISAKREGKRGKWRSGEISQKKGKTEKLQQTEMGDPPCNGQPF